MRPGPKAASRKRCLPPRGGQNLFDRLDRFDRPAEKTRRRAGGLGGQPKKCGGARGGLGGQPKKRGGARGGLARPARPVRRPDGRRKLI